jgi:hypothetical protein
MNKSNCKSDRRQDNSKGAVCMGVLLLLLLFVLLSNPSRGDGIQPQSTSAIIPSPPIATSTARAAPALDY